jgi:hypothetical protein
MKNVLSALILLLIPIISISQSLNELRLIKNVNDFKKVMIENNFQNVVYKGENKDIESNKDLVVFQKIEGKYKEGQKYAMYWPNKSMVFNWILTFNKATKFDYDEDGKMIKEYGDYKDIVDSIKRDCKYLEILKILDNDYVCYVCEDNVKIGFVIDKNNYANIINVSK